MSFRAHYFQMQVIVTLVILGIASALIFYFDDDTKFVVGVSLISGIVGYWLPNSNRSGKHKDRDVSLKNEEEENLIEKSEGDHDENDGEQSEISDSNDLSHKPLTKDEILTFVSSLNIKKDTSDIKNDTSDIRNEDGSKSTRTIKGLSPGVKESVAMIENGQAGKSKFVVNPHDDKSSDDDLDFTEMGVTNGSLHIAIP